MTGISAATCSWAWSSLFLAAPLLVVAGVSLNAAKQLLFPPRGLVAALVCRAVSPSRAG